jgi:hypothetical protein
VEQHVRLGDLVDCLRDEFRVAAVDGVMEAGERRFVAGCLGCWSIVAATDEPSGSSPVTIVTS